MKKQLKDYLNIKFPYEPVSFQDEKPLWMHSDMEKSKTRNYALAYLIVAVAAIGLTFLVLGIILLLKTYL